MSTLIKKEGKWVKAAIGDASLSFVRKPAWSQAITISSDDIVAGYTAPSDGIVIGTVYSTNINNNYLSVNSNSIIELAGTVNGNARPTSLFLQLNSGDILACVNTSIHVHAAMPKFVPFEDSIVAEPEVVTPEYIRNQNILSDYEAITIDSFTALYDGIINFMSVQGASGSVYILVNNVRIADMGTNNVPTGTSCGFSASVAIKKGDTITFEKNGATVPTVTGKARWYKLRDYTGR